MIKKLSIAVSYFHNKIGPIVYMSFPEDVLIKEEESRIADMLDQAFEEGMFTNKFGELYSLNYYFEIPSKWARGNKEMLMLSIVIDDAPSPENEKIIESWSDDFSAKLKTEDNIFQAFYKKDEINFTDAEDERDKHYRNLKNWVEDLYWLVNEEVREITEEEKWSMIMSDNKIFSVINKLSKGPRSKDHINIWFNEKFPGADFEDIVKRLEDEKFIFCNVIGHQEYILLVKEVSIMRVPPNCVIDLEEDSPELADLTQEYIQEVSVFFNGYKPNAVDSYELFVLFANSKIYNVISQLRSGPLPKEKVLSFVSERAKKSLIKNIQLLEEKKIIQEYAYGGERLYLLKTDVILTESFPLYLQTLLPQDSKKDKYVAKQLPHFEEDIEEEEEIMDEEFKAPSITEMSRVSEIFSLESGISKINGSINGKADQGNKQGENDIDTSSDNKKGKNAKNSFKNLNEGTIGTIGPNIKIDTHQENDDNIFNDIGTKKDEKSQKIDEFVEIEENEDKIKREKITQQFKLLLGKDT